MATSYKIERAWTPKDVKAFDCAMISKLGSDINSIDEGDIRNPNKLPLEANPTSFLGCRLKLEKSIFKNSSILVKEFVNKIENAKESNHKENNGENPSLPEWVTVANSQMTETLLTNIEAWWKESIGRATKSKSNTTGTVDLCFIVKRIVNDINEVIRGFLIDAKNEIMLPRR